MVDVVYKASGKRLQFAIENGHSNFVRFSQ